MSIDYNNMVHLNSSRSATNWSRKPPHLVTYATRSHTPTIPQNSPCIGLLSSHPICFRLPKGGALKSSDKPPEEKDFVFEADLLALRY